MPQCHVVHLVLLQPPLEPIAPSFVEHIYIECQHSTGLTSQKVVAELTVDFSKKVWEWKAVGLSPSPGSKDLATIPVYWKPPTTVGAGEPIALQPHEVPVGTRLIAYRRYAASLKSAAALASLIACIPYQRSYRLVAVRIVSNARGRLLDSRALGWFRSTVKNTEIDVRFTVMEASDGAAVMSEHRFLSSPEVVTLIRGPDVGDMVVTHMASNVLGFKLVRSVYGVFEWQSQFQCEEDWVSLTVEAMEGVLQHPMAWVSAPQHAVLLCRLTHYGREVAIAIDNEFKPAKLYMLPLTDEEETPDLIPAELLIRAEARNYYNACEKRLSQTLELLPGVLVAFHARRLWGVDQWRNSNTFQPESIAFQAHVLPTLGAPTDIAPGYGFNADMLLGDVVMPGMQPVTGETRWRPVSPFISTMLATIHPIPVLTAGLRIADIMLDCSTPAAVMDACCHGHAGVYVGSSVTATDGKTRIRSWTPLSKAEFEPTSVIITSDTTRWEKLHGERGHELDGKKVYVGPQPLRCIFRHGGMTLKHTPDGQCIIADGMEPMMKDFNVFSMLLASLATFSCDVTSSAVGMPHFIPQRIVCTLTPKSTFALLGIAWLSLPQAEGRAAKRHSMFGLCICPSESSPLQLLPMPGADAADPTL